jgi:tRNA A37 threonylcarbamoyladenosine modification protein TsaB
MESDAQEYCVLGDARRESFFFARVVHNELLEGPALFSGSNLKAKLGSLDATMAVFSSELLPQFDRAVVHYPSALVLARLAHEPRCGFSSPPLEPIYLREPHVTISR